MIHIFLHCTEPIINNNNDLPKFTILVESVVVINALGIRTVDVEPETFAIMERTRHVITNTPDAAYGRLCNDEKQGRIW